MKIRLSICSILKVSIQHSCLIFRCIRTARFRWTWGQRALGSKSRRGGGRGHIGRDLVRGGQLGRIWWRSTAWYRVTMLAFTMFEYNRRNMSSLLIFSRILPAIPIISAVPILYTVTILFAVLIICTVTIFSAVPILSISIILPLIGAIIPNRI